MCAEKIKENLRDIIKVLEKERNMKVNFIEDIRVVGKSNISHKVDFLISSKDKILYIRNPTANELEKEAIKASIEAYDIGSKIYLLSKEDATKLNELNKKVNSKLVEFVSVNEIKDKLIKELT